MDKKAIEKEFKEFKKKIEDLRKQLQKTGEKFLIENFKEIFKNFPSLESISWSQYTPYFNDGEECEFSSNHEYADIVGKGIEEGDDTHEAIQSYLNKIMSQFDDDLLESLFGDHVQLIVTKKGIKIEEYDHE